LPFVVRILGEYTGNNPSKPMEPLAKRKFIDINRDNFDDVLQKMAPGLNLRVANTLQNDNTEIGVQLTVNSFSDFEPARIVKQVEPLRKLLEARDKLKELLVKVDRSDKVESLLEQVLKSTEEAKKLSSELGISGPDGKPDGEGQSS